MQKKDCINCLNKSKSAQNLSAEEICELERNCSMAFFKPREIIIKENSLSSSLAYIKTGLVKIHSFVLGKEKTLRIINSQTYICLPSSFSDNRNHFSATAIENTEVCFLDVNIFKKFVKENGAFAFDIIHDLSQNQLKNLHLQVESNYKKSTGRIAQILLFFAKEIYKSLEFSLPISRQDIGDLTNTTREGVSRTLTDFNNNKIIKIDRKKITILNEKFLEEINIKG